MNQANWNQYKDNIDFSNVEITEDINICVDLITQNTQYAASIAVPKSKGQISNPGQCHGGMEGILSNKRKKESSSKTQEKFKCRESHLIQKAKCRRVIL
ncbi:hypothetical protein JTB14_024302 [Gonioctena quinquepunctata]|nr:hypothetical protein JTB14_024302 [Gonioctena quinquepunctata]